MIPYSLEEVEREDLSSRRVLATDGQADRAEEVRLGTREELRLLWVRATLAERGLIAKPAGVGEAIAVLGTPAIFRESITAAEGVLDTHTTALITLPGEAGVRAVREAVAHRVTPQEEPGEVHRSPLHQQRRTLVRAEAERDHSHPLLGLAALESSG